MANARGLTELFGGDGDQKVSAHAHRKAVETYSIHSGSNTIYLYPWEVEDMISALHALRRRVRDLGLTEK